MRTLLLTALTVAWLAAPTHAEVGGVPVIADPSLPTGDWAERVVLDLPPAARGTAPEVALAASHRTTDSEVGAGWRLQVGSAIHRRSLSNGVPTETSVLAGSRFALDGVELVAVTSPGIAHYQLETFDGSRVSYSATSDTWTRQRDGWTWYYGDLATTSAKSTRKISTPPQPVPACAAPCNTEAWFLRAVVDPFGNRIDYTYEVAAMPAELAATYTGFTSSKDHLVKTITYGAGAATVSFTYGPRADVTVDLRGGFPVVHHRRLTEVIASAGTTTYAHYYLQYEDDWGSHAVLGALTDCDDVPTATFPPDPGTPPGPTRLRKVHRAKGTLHQVIRCNQYHHAPQISWIYEDLTATIPDPFGGVDPLADRFAPMGVDLDGDARTDLVLNTSSSVYVYVATPSRSTPFADATGGGEAGALAAAWQSELRIKYVGSLQSKLGRALTDLDGDGVPEVLVEEVASNSVSIRHARPVIGPGGAITDLTFDDLPNSLAGCELRYGQTADVDGDGRPDLIVRAHGAGDGCAADATTHWLANLGAAPWFDSALRRELAVPVELGTAPGWAAAVAACPGGAVAWPTDLNTSWTQAGYLADQARYDDFNDDGITDVAHALYACWQVDIPLSRWRPVDASAYSMIFLGDGKGHFVNAGLSAGPPVLLDTLSWTTGDTRITAGTLAVADLDRDGRGELLQSSTTDDGAGFGVAYARRGSMDPAIGYGVSKDALLPAGDAVESSRWTAWDCSTTPGTKAAAYGDFDGDGFTDVVSIVAYDGFWYPALGRNARTVAEGRLIASDNADGGRTHLTWGFSAAPPNTNPDLPVNLEVLQAISGPGGARSLAYHGAVLTGDRTSPFAEVTATNDRGGVEVYSFIVAPWGAGKQSFGVRYREDGGVEHVSVLINGERLGDHFFADVGPPYFNPLVRRCEYDVGFGPVDLDQLDHGCGDVPWRTTAPGGGGPGPDDELVTAATAALVMGRDRDVSTAARAATFSRVWQPAASHAQPPRAGRGAATVAQAVAAASAPPPVVAGTFLRWPIPAALLGRIPDVEAQEAGYTYPLLGFGAPDGYAWDFAYDHPAYKLVQRYEHRDLATPADDRIVDYEWEQPSPTLGYWYRLLFERTSDRFGVRLTQLEQASFAGFDSARTVRRCGKASPGDCATDQYVFNSNGTLKTHTLPDQTSESWVRLGWCGEPTSYTDPIGLVTASPRDAVCQVKSVTRAGATTTFTYDDLMRVVKTVVDPGAGKTAAASMSSTHYYRAAPLYQAVVDAHEDWNYTQPTSATRRGDGHLELRYTDGLGRLTKEVECQDAGSDAVGGDIDLVACASGTTRTLAWNLYGLDGQRKIATAPFEGAEPPTTTGVGHDSQGRAIAVLAPHHGTTAGWLTSTVLYGNGYQQRTAPGPSGAIVTRVEESTLGDATTVDGVARGSSTRGLLGETTTVTAADGSSTALAYDDQFRLASETWVDAAGQPLLAAVVLPNGSSAQRPYEHTITDRDARGRVLEEVLPDGSVLAYGYDNLDRIVRREVDGVLQRTYTFAPATATQLSQVRVRDEVGGSETTSRADGLGRVWLESAPRVNNSVTYDTVGRVTSNTDIEGLTTAFHYDIHDRVDSVTAPGGATTTLGHDGAGRPTTSTDADGVVATYQYTYSGLPYRTYRGPYLTAERTYDPRGLATTTIDDGVTSVMSYDHLGRLESRREAVSGGSALRETRLAYDAGDRVTEVRQWPVAGPNIATTVTHYDAWGRPWETIDAAGGTVHREFDLAGRVRRTSDQEGATLETSYDDLGRVTDQQRPGGGWRHYRYTGKQQIDNDSNLWRIEEFDDEDAIGGAKTQRFVDGSGNPVATLHADGTSTHWTYALSRVVQEDVRDAAGASYRSTDYGYDAATGRLATTAQGPYAVTHDYTAAGRPWRTVTPDDVLERTYDHGLLATTTEAGVKTTYFRNPITGWIDRQEQQVGAGAVRSADVVRDALGRPTQVTWADGASHTVKAFELYDYFDHPRRTSNTDGLGVAPAVTEAWTYDAKGRPTDRTVSATGLADQTTQWTWYRNDALASVRSPSGQLLAYDYGATFDYQLDRLTQNGLELARVDARDLRGAIKTLALPTLGQVRTFGYDAAGRVASRGTGPSALAVDFGWAATHNPDGTLATESFDDNVGFAAWQNTYEYDGAGRLVAEVVGKSDATVEYQLDAAGNRESTTFTTSNPPVSAVTTALYDGSKLTQVGVHALTYDAWNAVSLDHHGNAYARSADGELAGVQLGANGMVLARSADGLPVAAFEPGAGVRRTTWGLSAAGLPLEVKQGGTVSTYVEVEGLHVGTLVNGVLGAVDADSRGVELRHGNAVLGDATAFGVGVAPPADADERYLYAGLERVPAVSEIMLARRRTYDPTIGRFLEPDPIGSAGGLELYQYGHGDPVNFTDPMGTTAVGSSCGTPPAIDPIDITTKTYQPLESGFSDMLRELVAIPNVPIDPFRHVGSRVNPRPPLDFPTPGPMCLANCRLLDGGDLTLASATTGWGEAYVQATGASADDGGASTEPTARQRIGAWWRRARTGLGDAGRALLAQGKARLIGGYAPRLRTVWRWLGGQWNEVEVAGRYRRGLAGMLRDWGRSAIAAVQRADGMVFGQLARDAVLNRLFWQDSIPQAMAAGDLGEFSSRVEEHAIGTLMFANGPFVLLASPSAQVGYLATFPKYLLGGGSLPSDLYRLYTAEDEASADAAARDTVEDVDRVVQGALQLTDVLTGVGAPSPSGAVLESPKTNIVKYGSTDMSQAALAYRRRHRLTGGNVAVFEYATGERLELIARASKRGVGHSERIISNALAEAGISPAQVKRIYSELEPCVSPGGYCKAHLADMYAHAEVTYSFPYGHSAVSRIVGTTFLKLSVARDFIRQP